MPDLQDVSDSSVNSDIEYMESEPNGGVDRQSNGSESTNDLIVEGPMDYETYCFMQEWLGGMSEVNESLVVISSSTPINHRALRARVSSKIIPCPPRTAEENRCLTLLVKINGLKAYTLFDSGSTGEVLSPHFTVAAGLKVHSLEKGVNIQLGTVGSRSKINFGVSAEITIGKIKTHHYFDVFNIDKYVFMCRYGLIIDLKNNVLRFEDNNVKLSALTLEEDRVEQARRSVSRVSSHTEAD